MSIKRYYKPQEARRVLGNISAKKLKTYVDAGILHRAYPPGQKQGVYPVDEVNRLASQLREFWEGEPDEEQRRTTHYTRSGRAATS